MAAHPDDSCQAICDNSNNVLRVMRELYAEKTMSDVFLKVGNKVHPAHRLVLCAFSDVFQAMLMRPEWTEWKESHLELQELEHCEPVFHIFLEYFYTGKILITHTNVLGLLCLADKYMVKSLTRLCIDYICKHISHATSHNVLFSWMQYTMACNHEEAADKCLNYVKWNLEAVANTCEFGTFDGELFACVLQQDDIVVYNEMVLFNVVARWLDLQRIAAVAGGASASAVRARMSALVESVMRHIRFPMMTPRELADLLMLSLINEHKEFFIDRLAVGMTFHAGQRDRLRQVAATSEGRRMLTPRLYTCDNFSAVLLMEDVPALPHYHTNTFVFSSSRSAADCDAESTHEWVADVYLKGVWFHRCYLIVWQGTLEVPEEVLKTTRLALSLRGPIAGGDDARGVRVRVAILVYAKVGGVESIVQVIERQHHFTEQSRLLNIDDFVPFDEIVPSAVDACATSPAAPAVPHSQYLIGPHNDQLKINIVITPRCADYD